MTPYLTLAIWVPIVAGLAVLAVGRDRDAAVARWIALAGSIAGFAVTLPLFLQFDAGTSAMQFVERGEWIPRFDIWYHLGVDGISVLFIILNAFTTVLVVWSAWEVIQSRVRRTRFGHLDLPVPCVHPELFEEAAALLELDHGGLRDALRSQGARAIRDRLSSLDLDAIADGHQQVFFRAMGAFHITLLNALVLQW